MVKHLFAQECSIAVASKILYLVIRGLDVDVPKNALEVLREVEDKMASRSGKASNDHCSLAKAHENTIDPPQKLARVILVTLMHAITIESEKVFKIALVHSLEDLKGLKLHSFKSYHLTVSQSSWTLPYICIHTSSRKDGQISGPFGILQ